jgi:hypothetical protein
MLRRIIIPAKRIGKYATFTGSFKTPIKKLFPEEIPDSCHLVNDSNPAIGTLRKLARSFPAKEKAKVNVAATNAVRRISNPFKMNCRT